MEYRFAQFLKRQEPLLITLFIALLAFLGFGIYKYLNLEEKLKLANAEISKQEESIKTLSQQKTEVEEQLEAEIQRNNAFADQISNIAGTVGNLEKLNRLDPELLQKYSKIYFLNENYFPSELAEIDKEFVLEEGKTVRVHARVVPFLESMIQDAQRDGVSLRLLSGYRSFGEQAGLKSNYKFTYGSGANQFSADQGYSEHQLGTTVDFTTVEHGAAFNSFSKTDGYEWLTENAYKYGFTLSYPEDNEYYTFEPWHWRFVGVELATELHNQNKHFYDFTQREIDTYLLNIFD